MHRHSHLRRHLWGRLMGRRDVRQVQEGVAQVFSNSPTASSHDTFGRVFARLDPVQFEACFTEWVRAVNEVMEGQVVAIDGKTIRRSHDRRADKSAIHMVSAWASANRLVLGQIRVDDHSNEITAIPELLRTLDVSGCTVTIDAIQKEIATTITDQGAHVLALKQNEPQLHDDVTDMFDHPAVEFSDLDHHFSDDRKGSRSNWTTVLGSDPAVGYRPWRGRSSCNGRVGAYRRW